MDWYASVMERSSWFREARLGMFVHFGLYAIPARGEWVRSVERTRVDDYQQYFDGFDPTALDMDEWMDLAVRAGAKYV
ncbi:MAG TPA: alpha-L-fucosidase, partial [Spirochaetia bacterium]|nr:alpha-L-fucosidase [Spirochaetia bacterium]